MYFKVLLVVIFTLLTPFKLYGPKTSIFLVESNPCNETVAGSFIPDRKACEKFYYCNQFGEAISVFCPEGMWFNPNKGICDLPAHTNCILDTVEPGATNEMITCPANDSKSVVFIPSKIDCRKYFLCYHGHPIEQECISELHWNSRTNRCDFPDKAMCMAGPVLPTCSPKGEEVLPHPYECDYFIYCINGHFSIQQCPFYHHWDIDSKSCQWQTKANCGSNNKTITKISPKH